MAAISSNGTGGGDWNVGASWDGGVSPGTGDTATILSGDTITITANQAVDGITINSGGELVINDTVTITTTEAWDVYGIVTADAGSGIALGNSKYLNVQNGGVFNANGTDAKHVTISGESDDYLFLREASDAILTFVDFTRVGIRTYEQYHTSLLVMEDCDIDMADGYGFYLGGPQVVLRRCFIHGCRYSGMMCGGYTLSNLALENVVFGYTRAGALDENSTTPGYGDIRFANNQTGIVFLRNTVWTKGPTWNSPTTRMASPGGLYIDNLGHVTSAMLPGTSSALDNAVVGAGIGRRITCLGSIERSTAAKKTGDFGVRATPDAEVNTNKALESSIYIPISTGDNISVSVYGRRHLMTDDCAEVEIDPEGAWFTPTTAATTMTEADTQWYEFAPSANGAGGSSDTGMVRIVLRLKEYEAGAYMDWADMVVVAGGTTYNINFDVWEMGQPAISEPSGGGGRRPRARYHNV